MADKNKEEFDLDEKVRKAVVDLTQEGSAIIGMQDNLSDQFKNTAYKSILENEEYAGLKKRDEHNRWVKIGHSSKDPKEKALASKFVQDYKESLIDTMYNDYVQNVKNRNKEASPEDREFFKENIMQSLYGISEPEIESLVKNVNTLDEDHIKTAVHDQIAQRKVQAQLQKNLQHLDEIKGTAAYDQQFGAIKSEIENYAAHIGYEGPLPELLDTRDLQSAFQQLTSYSMQTAQQAKAVSGNAIPNVTKKYQPVNQK